MRLRRLIWWMALMAFVCSAVWIGWYFYQAYFGAESIQGLSYEIVEQRAASIPGESAQAPGETGITPQGKRDVQTEDKVLAAYAELAVKNPEMVGWIYIEGTMVDYPVMHSPKDPEKYLHRDFEGQYAFAGLPFLDAQCDPQAGSANLILYAHNMRSGQMFAQLTEYLDPIFRAEHPVITFDTLARRGEYQVVAVLQLRAIGRQEPSMRCYRQIDTTDQEAVDELNEYLKRFASFWGCEFQLGDDILTLSTCERIAGTDRLVVMARRVPEAPRD